jgi:hypothetical protein
MKDQQKIDINKNVNIRLFKILNLRKFFTDCFAILTQRCIRIRAFFYIPTVYISSTFTPVNGKNMLLLNHTAL